MIAGNPKSGRMVATLAIATLLAMILITAIMARRKKTPLKEPPLHPSVVVGVYGY